ncbi:ATP-binding cassette domain-containing protein [Clostridium botulinum]|uniref:Bacitracin ABC transporter, ATP-binding protein n=1 Tax=Clostridium botulinum (strain Langeland / NCTC 10281 / Type F) TaxID=441772 RepID=A7GBH5_CLOBL|nr:ABC transporter ATP-binding protein [Clostridium botulinum]ABS40277.1 bacitracin ABC transporter, ATP-binding protein [Clostridium botulinum F str. Langeland]ADF98602.1 bacitracin ABC transporter, ATP-binding protein [Clostridium botulinum F str. 230613]KKM40113.1 bacitracin ABC transporter ATP-binding protein [Clostridium botulinum]MBY6791870.1 ABC transporter ATP-binding protein [Clostridium botulinum]MBY6935877.1 ABC transporter ATP-binding protein [Clostridium botulinum]
MSEYILKTTNLSKKYKKDFVVNNLNISIKRGEIYGFIGENGAGKTTFIRMITGLVAPTNGEIKLFSKEKGDELGSVRKRIGALIERPAFYPYMTAYENLEAFRIEKGIPGKECIDKILKSVGLYEDKNKKLKNFSLGMKQKLALAIALLGDPEFLILDEPINGLDPMGIKEVRELLKKLNKEKNITMLISSHILGELYQLANCYGIIHKGKLMEQITLKELDEKCKRSLSIRVDDVNKAATILETELSTNNFKVLPDGTIRLYDYVDNSRLVSSTLTKANIIIDQIMPNESNLEEYFINLVGGDLK